MNPVAEHGDVIAEALAPGVLYEEPVVINPEAFLAERWRQFRHLRTRQPLSHRPVVRERKVLCDSCFCGSHACSDNTCPCMCKERIAQSE